MGLPKSAHAMPPREINALWSLLILDPSISQIPYEKGIEREHQISSQDLISRSFPDSAGRRNIRR
jgi:hypothetical protein